MRIPIAFKLILLVIIAIVLTTGFIVDKSSHLFESVLTQREEDTNLATASSRMKEVDAALLSIKERVEVIGTLMAKQGVDQHPQDNIGAVNDITLNFNKDKTMVSLEVYRVTSKGMELMTRKVKTELLEPYKLGANYIDYLRTYAPFPMHSVSEKNIEVINSSFPIGPPLITMGVPVLRDEFDNVSHIAIADFSLGVLQKAFSQSSEHMLFLVDKNGIALAHQNEVMALARRKMTNSPIVAKALKDSSKIPQQTQFTDPETNKVIIGAYAKSPFGVTAFSQIEKDKILEPARVVRNDAINIAGTMIAGALFLSFLFSMSLTSPIEKLAELIEVVAKGNFDIKARSQVKSNDEVGDLAKAFDHMTEGLRERDKVKSLFSKFHGSSVAEDLMKNEIGVGGQNKEVTIFFSDIRGFTAFSENRTPEEVVDMLNEYFSVMVGIINKNGGVVDKFIGDAIMAVWGAPKGTPDDTIHALTACMEMRKALVDLNQKRESRGQPPLMVGMGVHYGRAISGTIGSQERMEYTVIGDTVNMTSRIESSTKVFGADLLVSEDVVKKVGDHFIFELAGVVEVKGKAEPIQLYKVRGIKFENGTEEIIATPYSDYAKAKADKIKMAS